MLFVGPLLIVFEVEVSSIIWAGDHAVPATNTPVMIYNDYTIVTLVCSADGTDLGARRIFAMIAQKNHRFLGSFWTNLAFDFDLSDPMYVPPVVSVKSNVVLLATRVQTCSAIRVAFGEIDNHPPSERRQPAIFTTPTRT
jgi:hypothetical protein